MAKRKHPLHHLIPDKSYADEYISRVLKGGVRDTLLLKYAMDTGRNASLFGPTGPGKTSLVSAYCAAEDLPLVTIACNGGVDPNTLFTSVVPTSEGGIEILDSDMTKLIRAGNGVLYFDEVNFLPQRIAAVLHPLFDKRRQITLVDRGGELIVAGERLQIITSYNPDYDGTRPLNAAFKNRFPLKIPFGYDTEVEAELLNFEVTPRIAERLREASRNGTIETPVSTNMLMEFEDFCLDLAPDFAIANFLAAFSAVEISAVGEVVELFRDEIEAQTKAALEELEE